MDVEKSFGRSVKIRRVEVGITQEELAHRADLARSFVSGIERGAVKATITSVWSLSKALDCNPSDLWLLTERLLNSAQK